MKKANIQICKNSNVDSILNIRFIFVVWYYKAEPAASKIYEWPRSQTMKFYSNAARKQTIAILPRWFLTTTHNAWAL